ncbi:GNAT family N-acetyltransferase [Phaeobacter gallaeciensis]|uniref:GNAT family N-acetyltransferase n=2 Tax=Roseobacteraceae TaxID=2854170 RepID=A0A366WV80_9RHOB|nr:MULTISPECIES: GNAT family N-acetyltransferase [Roseobacteraceae]MBT3140311.1 GNAT family N-acetyltransferase [Falsiruegeria litorea]MBT8171053.1 GNAT family N-acetyltransferase [Falsiruegeria litorea]RBW53406.1 GNAT family N-acetyltransferase [Phaeobacter gallaeciensis]
MKLDAIINQPVIETERFDLRPLRRSDLGLIEHYASDERVARMTTSIPHPLPPGLIEGFIARAMAESRDEDVWAIDGSKDGGNELKGVISLKKLDRNQSEVAYWVAPIFWNSGIASLAVEALVSANPMKNDTMFASVFQDNPASARVLTHCGFQYLGDAESFAVARDATVPTWTYSHKLI